MSGARWVWGLIAASLILLAMTGCATLGAESAQGRAGVTDVEVRWCERADGSDRYLCGARWVDGKERQDVSLTLDLPDGGKLRYAASGVAAFDGQRLRAEVERALVEQVGAAAPAAVDAIMRAIRATVGVP